MKTTLSLLIALTFLLGCKKSGVKPEPAKPKTYEIRIETSAAVPPGNYGIKAETMSGPGRVYFNKTDQTGTQVYTLNPDNDEPVAIYYYTNFTGLWFKIYLNGKKIIDQTQAPGSGAFYLHKP